MKRNDDGGPNPGFRVDPKKMKEQTMITRLYVKRICNNYN